MSEAIKMPKELTAENGAKGLLSGEFKEVIDIYCDNCNSGTVTDPSGSEYECEECSGSGYVNQSVPISWSTIKDIYAMAVKHLEVKE